MSGRISPFLRAMFAALAVGLTFLCPPSWAAESHRLSRAVGSIQPDELQAYVDHLADDALAGREAGTSGGRAAADYLADRLEQIGLQGAAEDGTFFQPFGAGYRNVLARIEGRDGPADRQTVVLCAHYDHVGRGSRGNSLGTVGEIHNGADDNASGVAGLLETAEAFGFLETPPRRDVLFAFWDAEEKGLLGSKHWIAHPTVPLDRVVAVVNLDMIGRLRDDRLTMFGSRTAAGLRRLVATNNRQADLRIEFSWSLVGNGDHYPFLIRRIPVLFAHTGVHGEYHRESDDAELINSEGMGRVVQLVFGMAHELAERDEPPEYRAVCRNESASRAVTAGQEVGAVPPRLGASWNPSQNEGPGVVLSAVAPGSAAEKAGIRPGDRLIEVAGWEIRSGEDLSGAVITAHSPARVVVQPKDGQTVRELTVELDGSPLRLGITWKTDDAEPGVVILTSIVEGSAAWRAGLRRGDRIYQVNGRDFNDDGQFADWVTTLPGPLELLVERDGRLSTAVVRFIDDPEERRGEGTARQ